MSPHDAPNDDNHCDHDRATDTGDGGWHCPDCDAEGDDESPVAGAPPEPAIRRHLAALGMGINDVARLVGTDRRNVARWVSGSSPMPISVDLLLSVMRVHKLDAKAVIAAWEGIE